MAKTKAQLKTETREKIQGLFEAQGCTVEEKTAGNKYLAVSLPDSKQRIAAIYGSLGGAASVWLKEAAWDDLRGHIKDPSKHRVEDVGDFRRGFQWAVHFDGPDDPLIHGAVECAVRAGRNRWDKTQHRRAEDARRTKAAAERKVQRDANKRDPWAVTK